MMIFRYIFLSFCALIELMLLLFGLTGVGLLGGSAGSGVPRGFVLSVIGCAAGLIVITLVSFYRVREDRKFPVLYGLFFKIPVIVLALGTSWFALDIPEAGWIAVVIAVLFTALLIWLVRHGNDNSGKRNTVKVPAFPAFSGDKAEWAYDDAAAEYLRLIGEPQDTETDQGKKALADRIAAMPDSEKEKIYDYAGTPIAYFMGWLIERGLVSDAFLDMHATEELQAFRDGIRTPVELFREMDYVLAADDIRQEAMHFVNLYYNSAKGVMPFSHNTHRYFFDYYRIVCCGSDVPRYYCVDFSWDSYRELVQVLDRRCHDFSVSVIDEDEIVYDERKLRSRYFDTEAELFHEPGTPQEYVDMCAGAFENIGAHLCRDMSESLVEYCTGELTDEELLPENILRKFRPYKVVVMKPEGAQEMPADTPVPAYVILGESEWEEEHGISFTVIGDFAVNCGYYADAESPWEEDMRWNYLIRRDAENGHVCAVSLIPEQFGGSNEADNQVTVPVAAARRKNEVDILVEALFILGYVQKYDCKVTYHEGKPNYLFVSALKGDSRVFADSIRVQ